MVGTIAIAAIDVYSSPDHSKVGQFENRPLECPVFECFRFSNGRISDPHCILLYISNGALNSGQFVCYSDAQLVAGTGHLNIIHFLLSGKIFPWGAVLRWLFSHFFHN